MVNYFPISQGPFSFLPQQQIIPQFFIIPRQRVAPIQEIIYQTLNVNNEEHDTVVFNQSIAANVWTINHNLNQFPSVSLVDTLNKNIMADIKYINSNQIIVTFSRPVAGKAYLNI